MSNQNPIGNSSIQLVSGKQNGVYDFSEKDLLQGFSDPDGDKIKLANLWVDHGSLVDLSAGQWQFIPDSEYVGRVTLDYVVVDGKGGSLPGSLNFTLTAVPRVPAFVMNKTDVSTGENGDTAVVSLNLATAPTRDVSVTFVSSMPTEGIVSNPTLTFTSNNWSIPQRITVIGQNDYVYDGNQPYSIKATINSSDVNYRQLLIDPIVMVNAEDVTTQSDAMIPIGTIRDKPLKIYGDAVIDPTVIDPITGVFKIIGRTPVNDILHGLDGNDTIYGADLQDDLSGGIGDDILYGENDEDHLYGQSGNDTLFGGGGIDTLEGGLGNDVLEGGAGDLATDVLIGGPGDDIYYLGYNGEDVITDNGLITDVDTVVMPYQVSSYTLPNDIEKGMMAKGTTSSSLTGNDKNNTLIGNDGKNVLDGSMGDDALQGGGGSDTLIGGAGNDSIVAGDGNDLIVGGNGLGDDDYHGDSGIDTIKYSSAVHGIKVDLGNNFASGTDIGNDRLYGIENIIAGQGADQLIGSADNNQIDGYLGNDTLSGGLGNDILTGGLGKDSFVFDSALKNNVDKITDFNPWEDQIVLENQIFKQLTQTGGLVTAQFFSGATAHDSNDFVIYNPFNGALSYDADGSGAEYSMQIAILGTNLTLTSANFVVS